MERYIKRNWFRIFLLAVAVLSGGFVGIRFLTGIIPFYILILIPIFILFSVLAIVFPFKNDKDQKYNFTRALVNYVVGLIFSFGLFGLLYLSYNYSRTLLKADFTWDYQMSLILRANGSYKLVNNNMFDCQVEYGHYDLNGNMIIASGLHFAGVPMRDTLYLSNDAKYLEFKLIKEIKGMNQGRMSIVVNALSH